MRRREFLSVLSGVAATWPPLARAQRLQEPAINIGVLTDMSGLFATLAGSGSVAAAEMAVRDFGGEVFGKKIRVLFGDHKHKVDVASAIVTQWFNDEFVGAIFDMPNSSVALACQRLATERGRIAVTVSGGSSDLTGKDCSSTGFHWAYDTYSNTAGIASAMVRFGLDTWYFITADYAFGWQLEHDASAAIVRAGGRVIGHSRHPLNAKSFLEYLGTAQDSGAKVIALANAGGDTINAVKQAAEIGISPRSQTLVPLLVFISDVHTLGLDVAKGMTFIDGFYWDADDLTRAWSKQFFDQRKAMPTMGHAGVYSSVLHYLRAVQLKLDLAEYSIQDVAQTVYGAVEPLAVDKKLAFKCEVAPNLPMGCGDGRRLTQVLLNLVGNAIKFTDAGEVVIKAEASDGSFNLSVRDTGPGLSAADQQKLFQEFQQADNSITRKKGGTGLGLAISKRIVEMHGGRIWVESVVGQGSTFALTLPVRVEQQVKVD